MFNFKNKFMEIPGKAREIQRISLEILWQDLGDRPANNTESHGYNSWGFFCFVVVYGQMAFSRLSV